MFRFHKSVGCRTLQLSFINQDYCPLRRWGAKLKKNFFPLKTFSHVIIFQNLRTVLISVSLSFSLWRKTREDALIDTSHRKDRPCCAEAGPGVCPREAPEGGGGGVAWSKWWHRSLMWRLYECLGYVFIPCIKYFWRVCDEIWRMYPLAHPLPPYSPRSWLINRQNWNWQRGRSSTRALGRGQLGDWGLPAPIARADAALQTTGPVGASWGENGDLRPLQGGQALLPVLTQRSDELLCVVRARSRGACAQWLLAGQVYSEESVACELSSMSSQNYSCGERSRRRGRGEGWTLLQTSL